MKKNHSTNRLMHSISTNTSNKLSDLMNSPNYGKQQIILQNCSFFDYEKSHTPHASPENCNYFDMKKKNKNKIDSIMQTPYSKNYKTVYLQTKKNLDKIKSRIDGIQNNNDEYISSIEKLKKENKALKDTINNLIVQLDKVFNIAEIAKNNEMNTIEMNKNNKQELDNLKNKINSLTIEKEKLLKQIKEQEIDLKNININYQNNQMVNYKNKKINNKINHKRNISDVNIGFVKKINNNIDVTENNEINENRQLIEIIDKLNQENEKLRNKMNEENSISINIFHEKEQQIQNLLQENYDLKQSIKELKITNEKDEINK